MGVNSSASFLAAGLLGAPATGGLSLSPISPATETAAARALPLAVCLPALLEASGVFAIAARDLLIPSWGRPSYCLPSFTLGPRSSAIAPPIGHAGVSRITPPGSVATRPSANRRPPRSNRRPCQEPRAWAPPRMQPPGADTQQSVDKYSASCLGIGSSGILAGSRSRRQPSARPRPQRPAGECLEDIHSTEQNAITQLTDGANAADDEVLAAAFNDHLIDTQEHERLIADRLMVQRLPARGRGREGGDAIDAPDRRVQGELQRFKELIEASRHQTGGWRGEIKQSRRDRRVDR